MKELADSDTGRHVDLPEGWTGGWQTASWWSTRAGTGGSWGSWSWKDGNQADTDAEHEKPRTTAAGSRLETPSEGSHIGDAAGFAVGIDGNKAVLPEDRAAVEAAHAQGASVRLHPAPSTALAVRQFSPDIWEKVNLPEDDEHQGPMFTKWRWDGSLVGPEDGGLPLIVNVRKFDRHRDKEKVWMENDKRPSVVLNNLIAKQATVGDLLDLFAERCREFMIVNSVTALHRVAGFGDANDARSDPRLDKLLREMQFMFPPKKPLELANIAWSLARLRMPDHPLRPAISSQSIAQMTEFYGQSMANMAWSCAV